MFRAIIYALLAIFVLTVFRMIAGVLTRGVSEMMNPAQPPPGQRPPQSMPTGGELKRDPVCGTYVPAATAVTKTVAGQVHHFCSAQCRDKYLA